MLRDQAWQRKTAHNYLTTYRNSLFSASFYGQVHSCINGAEKHFFSWSPPNMTNSIKAMIMNSVCISPKLLFRTATWSFTNGVGSCFFPSLLCLPSSYTKYKVECDRPSYIIFIGIILSSAIVLMSQVNHTVDLTPLQ